MKPLALYLEGFNDVSYKALIRILGLMSKKFDFEYIITDKPKDADLAFFENVIPKDFPKGLPVPQMIISDGRTYCGCRENQHRITWGTLEAQIGIITNVFKRATSFTWSIQIQKD